MQNHGRRGVAATFRLVAIVWGCSPPRPAIQSPSPTAAPVARPRAILKSSGLVYVLAEAKASRGERGGGAARDATKSLDQGKSRIERRSAGSLLVALDSSAVIRQIVSFSVINFLVTSTEVVSAPSARRMRVTFHLRGPRALRVSQPFSPLSARRRAVYLHREARANK